MEHVLELRNTFGRHLQADRQAGLSSAFLHAGNERGSSSQPAWPGMVLPVVNSLNPVSPRAIHMRHRLARIGCEDVAREDAGEPLGIGPRRRRPRRVVVSVARRRLDQSALSGFPPDPAPRSAARRSRAAARDHAD